MIAFGKRHGCGVIGSLLRCILPLVLVCFCTAIESQAQSTLIQVPSRRAMVFSHNGVYLLHLVFGRLDPPL